MFGSLKKSLVLEKVAGGYVENNESMTVTATYQQLGVYGGIGGYKASLRLFVCKLKQLVMPQHTEIRNKTQMPSIDTAFIDTH